MDHFSIRPISEDDVERLVVDAGGRRAHPGADQRSKPGADFVLDDIVIELKALDENGLEKPERQQKLADLFRQYEPARPVIVLDRKTLPKPAQALYDRAMEGPIKGAVASARKQLKQSRSELAGTARSVLFVLNNGYTALNHDELTELVTRRVRNDTTEIDGVIVAGCYFHSDTFDSFFLWPIDYVPIKVDAAFPGFERIREQWNGLASEAMTELMMKGHERAVKGPVVDSQFEIDNVTYVKPAPPIGRRSDFFVTGRPRKDSSGLDKCPPVGLTFPELTRVEWQRFRQAFPNSPDLFNTYEDWLRGREAAIAEGIPTRPFVPMSVTFDAWSGWCAAKKKPRSMRSVRNYANSLFNFRIHEVLDGLREWTPDSILPPHYVLAVTEVIGQDKANDVSHIARMHELPDGTTDIDLIVEDVRMFHEHAVAVASAYAVAKGISAVLWQKNQRYGWT